MKKLGFLLVMLSLGVITIGCSGDTASTPPASPPAAGGDADKAPDDATTPAEDPATPAEGADQS
jgi:hypothetical protein